VDVLVSSEVESKIYECRAVGIPTDVTITFRQESDPRPLSGVEVQSFVENGETVGTVRLRPNIGSIECAAENGNSQSIRSNNFQRLAPINGKPECTVMVFFYTPGRD
jgi:hypothetical protein